MKDIELFLKQMDRIEMANRVRKLNEDNKELRIELSYVELRKEMAERYLLAEWDKGFFRKLLSIF